MFPKRYRTYPKIKSLLAYYNKTQKELADYLGRTETHVSRCMSGKFDFRASDMDRIYLFFKEAAKEIDKTPPTYDVIFLD